MLKKICQIGFWGLLTGIVGLSVYGALTVGWWVLVVFVVVLLLLEAALRAAKSLDEYELDSVSWEYGKLRKEIVHSGKLYGPDERLGWGLRPGVLFTETISMPELEESLEWTCHVDDKGRRKTGGEDKAGPAVAVFGCSLAFGDKLDQKDTVAARLQKRFDRHRVVNFGVSGYSIYQMLLQLQHCSADLELDTVVLCFHSLLDERHVARFDQRLYQQRTFNRPGCISKGKQLKCHSPKKYAEFPFSKRVRLLHLLEFCHNRIRFMGGDDPELMRRTCEHVLLQFRKDVERRGAKLLVACLSDSKAYYDFFRKNHFDWCVCSKRYMPGESSKYTLMPLDNHPNANTNAKYCEVIGSSLETLWDKGRRMPDVLETGGHAFQEDGTKATYIYQHF